MNDTTSNDSGSMLGNRFKGKGVTAAPADCDLWPREGLGWNVWVCACLDFPTCDGIRNGGCLKRVEGHMGGIEGNEGRGVCAACVLGMCIWAYSATDSLTCRSISC